MLEYLSDAKVLTRPYPYILPLGNNFQVLVIINSQALEHHTLLQVMSTPNPFLSLKPSPQEWVHVLVFLQIIIKEIPGWESKLVTFLHRRILG